MKLCPETPVLVFNFRKKNTKIIVMMSGKFVDCDHILSETFIFSLRFFAFVQLVKAKKFATKANQISFNQPAAVSNQPV